MHISSVHIQHLEIVSQGVSEELIAQRLVTVYSKHAGKMTRFIYMQFFWKMSKHFQEVTCTYSLCQYNYVKFGENQPKGVRGLRTWVHKVGTLYEDGRLLGIHQSITPMYFVQPSQNRLDPFILTNTNGNEALFNWASSPCDYKNHIGEVFTRFYDWQMERLRCLIPLPLLFKNS
jgi:hypothetical protein